MARALMHRIDDGLAAGADIVVLGIQVDDPAQRLLRRGDVVALGAEADDRRANVAQVDPLAGTRDDLRRGESVADKQLIDDPLNLLGIEVDVATPPFLELKKALGTGIDRLPDVVVLAPVRISWVEVLEVLDQ